MESSPSLLEEHAKHIKDRGVHSADAPVICSTFKLQVHHSLRSRVTYQCDIEVRMLVAHTLNATIAMLVSKSERLQHA